jgi:uncharacterized protein YyaL (SSP411 family)
MSWIANGLLVALGLAWQEGEGPRKPLPTAEEIRKLPPDGGPEFNRLVFEKSPYLLQHARNPVDWYPWGDAAFERAKQEDKPVFLSVGYSTCHWCHVMEHESFEDDEVAALLNAGYICIKVDREERPDIDQIYMAVTQGMTGSGGWPMTVVMTPERKPFFAATYIPKGTSLGRTGLMTLLPQLAEAWKTRKQEITARADQVVQWLERSVAGRPGSALDASTLDQAGKELAARFDAVEGGFGNSPKFPIPHQIRLLLRNWVRTKDAKALSMAERSLQAMAAGGIHDHLGGGFHRYATDRKWLVPHFEKMLYDQALIALAYIEAFEATRKPEYKAVAEDIFAYVLRDLLSPDGAFYSAEDADSEGEEGRFYVWTRAEVLAVLGEEEGPFFADAYGVEAAGNIPQEPGRNVLHRVARAGSTTSADEERLAKARARLFTARQERPRPLCDDKIMTDWNGLMIAAFARGARAFDEPKYAAAAERAMDSVLGRLHDGKGGLLRRWRDGEAAHDGVIEDYAFLIFGLLELYETNFDAGRLAEAVKLRDVMVANFWDEEDGGFFTTANGAEALLARAKDVYDGAIPSGNSVAALDLARLGHLTGSMEDLARAERVFRAFSGSIAESPSQYAQMMLALDTVLGPAGEIVIAGDPEAADTKAMLREARSRYLPNVVVILRPPGDEAPIVKLAPFVLDLTQRDGKATAYFCRNFTCQAPTTDPAALAKLLAE